MLDVLIVDGSFDGSWSKGVTHVKTDDRPWYARVKGFKPPAAGEHPRLLFRKSDLPALRKKAKTPRARRSSSVCVICWTARTAKR